MLGGKIDKQIMESPGEEERSKFSLEDGKQEASSVSGVKESGIAVSEVEKQGNTICETGPGKCLVTGSCLSMHDPN